MKPSLRRAAALAVALLALVSSVLGIFNGFAFDDVYVVERNPMMKYLHGWWHVFRLSYWPKSAGGDGYRPITILAFRIEGVLGHLNPMVYHATNIALYVVASLLVLSVGRRILPLWAACVAAALFAVHPVHVEAVANVVGQSELWVAVAILAATSLYLRDRMVGPLKASTALWVLLLYAVACFSKEHGIVLPAILVAAELTVIPDRTPLLERARRMRPFYLATIAVALGFLAARGAVLADHSLGGFAPFTPFASLNTSPRDRVLTAIGVVPQWLRLLYWPARLSAEYGPPQVDIAQGFSVAQLPGFLLLVAIIAAAVVLRRRQPAASFSIALAAIALLPSSNLLLPAGIVVAERTLFLTSAGAMLLVGALVAAGLNALRQSTASVRPWTLAGSTACGALICLGTARSLTRTPVWRDNETLFKQSVIDAPDSYRVHFLLGAWDIEKKRKREGEAELRLGIRLFPYDASAPLNLAEAYRQSGMCAAALPLYQWARALAPSSPGRTEYAWCLLDQGKYAESKRMAVEAVGAGGSVKLLHQIMAADDTGLAMARRSDSTGKTPVTEIRPAPSKLQDTVQKAAGKAGSATP
jgi:protein O-mannosyl-transferase